MPRERTTRPSVGNNPNIPIPVARELRKVSDAAFGAQQRADEALTGLAGKVSKDQKDLLDVSKFVSQQVQAGGVAPINLTGLVGSPSGAVISVNGLKGEIVIVAGAGMVVDITGTPGNQKIEIKLPNTGPGVGTYTVGAKLTGGGTNGQIAVDSQGRVTAITPAT